MVLSKNANFKSMNFQEPIRESHTIMMARETSGLATFEFIKFQ